jgi:hypothetical protein
MSDFAEKAVRDRDREFHSSWCQFFIASLHRVGPTTAAELADISLELYKGRYAAFSAADSTSTAPAVRPTAEGLVLPGDVK